MREVLGLESEIKKESDPNSNFVGIVSVKMLHTPDSIVNAPIASVTFEPGARTNWHYHPAGQTLIITDGVAYYQEKGKPKQILSKGQVVKCSPNVHHWHGAARHTSMTHTVLTPGGVVWMQKVTDEEYENKN